MPAAGWAQFVEKEIIVGDFDEGVEREIIIGDTDDSAGNRDSEYLITGTTTGTGNTYPVDTYRNYSMSQQIQLASSITDAGAGAGTIKKIAFYVDSNTTSSSRSIEIYMKHTTRSSFSSYSDWESVTASDKVYDGTFNTTSTGWKTLTLNTPFVWNGTNNILIRVYDKTGSAGATYNNFTTFTTYRPGTNIRMCAAYQDNAYSSGTSSPSNGRTSNSYVNKVKLTIAPTSFDISVTASPSAGGTVTGGGSYSSGASCTLTANPASGYIFWKWNDGSTTNPRTFNVSSNVSYTATFVPTSINSSTRWDEFCDAVNAGYTYSGQTVTLSSSFSISKMAGTSSTKSFQGTFNGNNYQLTLSDGQFGTSSSSVSTTYCAPFSYVSSATIQNLVVTGYIYTSGQSAGGICGAMYGGNNTMENCVSNVTITSSKARVGGLCGQVYPDSSSGTATFLNCKGNATIISKFTSSSDNTNYGGLIGRVENGTANITGCSCTGSMQLGSGGTYYCKGNGGMIGFIMTTVNFTDCLFATESYSSSTATDSYSFSRNYSSSTVTYTNCYYTTLYGTANTDTKQARTITGSGGVTVALYGSGTSYNKSAITTHGTDKGIDFNSTHYAASGVTADLRLGLSTAGYKPTSYSASNGTLSGTAVTGSNDAYTLNTTANTTITATKEKRNYTVSWTNPTGGTITVKNGSTPLSSGASVPYETTLTITATPSESYGFDNWYNGTTYGTFGNATTSETTFTVGAGDATLFANIHAPAPSFPYSDGFEGTNNWTLVNGSLTNKWCLGSDANNGGSNAMYISNNGGTNNQYSTGSPAVVYAYRLLHLDAGTYNFSYDWIANGESTCDFLRVVLVPSSTTFSSSTTVPSGFSYNTLPPAWSATALDDGGKLNLVSAWQHKDIENVVISTGGDYKLVFIWRNDSSAGSQPPAAIDNVSVTKICTVNVLSNNMSFGTVSGGGTYVSGTSITVIASANSGYTFANWTDGGTVVSTNPSYTFTVSDSRTLIANFVMVADNISVSGTTTIDCGSSTTLTASGISGATYKWYSDAGCENLLYTGSSYTTATLYADATYYVKAEIEGSPLVEGTPVTFSYTGAEQSYTVPSNVSKVKLEVWGAQGGGTATAGGGGDNPKTGGKGGYSKGVMSLSSSTTLYIYVGGQGAEDNRSNAGTAVITAGGFNGGGATSTCGAAGSGGGATDIRIGSNTLYNRVIVAGGGGAGWNSNGFAGGGEYGICYAGTTTTSASGAYSGAGGPTSGGSKATSGYNSSYGTITDGSFGQGGTGVGSSSGSGGGGGGWYGGGGSGYSGGSGGGSGYVWTSATASSAPSGYSVSTSYYLTEAQTIAGNASMPNPSGGTMTGRSGHGYARITPYTSSDCETAAKAVTVTVNACGHTVTITTASGGTVLATTTTGTSGTSGSTSTASVNANGDVTVTATAATGYTFKYMTDGSTVINSPTTSYTIDAVTTDMNFTAYFVEQATAGSERTSWVSSVTDNPGTSHIEMSSGNATVKSEQGLAWLVSMVNGLNGQSGISFSGQTVTLTADIDMSGLDWVPIGTAEAPFQGTFEGNGHTITGLTRSTEIPHEGLFGYISGGGNVKHVVAEVNFTGNSITTGAIAGTYASSGLMYNVEGAGTLTGGANTTAIGGLVGATSGTGAIHSSFAVAALTGVSSSTQMGGLVGDNAVNVYNCYSNGTYAGTTATKGGLVGTNASGKGIENCYAAGIASGVSAFAGSNSGTIQYCYANFVDGITYTDGGTLSGHGTYGVVQDIKNLNYMYRDNAITLASGEENDYVTATGYTNNHTPKWNGLVSALNQWVSAHSAEGLTQWYRPMTSNINGDLPVLGFGSANSLATLDSDKKCLHYGSTASSANGIDALLAAYNDNDSGDPELNASIFLYGNATDVSRVPTSNVKVFVQEDAVLLQRTSAKTTPDPFTNTTVGITFDNSKGDAASAAGSGYAVDYLGNTLQYDWHLMSTPLRNAEVGATYSLTDGSHNYIGSGNPNSTSDITAIGGYFPDDLLTSGWKWDFYFFHEPTYHWINMKRNRNNHYHQETGAPINYDGIDQPSTDNVEDKGYYIPGKGYMMAISENTYMSTSGTLNSGNVTVTLSNSAADKGWNLVGNPYQGYLDLSKITDKYDGSGDKGLLNKFYIYDADQKVFAPVSTESSDNPRIPSYIIHPHQGFFVYTGSDETLAFDPEWTTTSDAAYYYRTDKVNYPLVNLVVENEKGQRDLAVVEFHRPEIGGVEKIEAMRNAPFRLSAYHDRTDYAILFTTDEMARIPVHFKTGEDGPMTLTWDTHNGEFNSLHLVDNITGVNYDMLTHDSYTFNASVEDYSARFYITYDCSGTGIEENDNDGASTGSATFAYINNGNIIIDVADARGASLQVIDVMGRVLVCRDALNASPISTAGMAPGVYLLRLADSKQVRVQKIVVR